MTIILMTIGGFFVIGCWWLLMVIILMSIGVYFIGGLLMFINVIILMAIGGYSNVNHWWLFYW